MAVFVFGSFSLITVVSNYGVWFEHVDGEIYCRVI